MLRTRMWLALVLIAAGAATACTRSDVTGPSQDNHPSLEKQGGNG